MITEEMVKKIPKVELHDHLDGGLRPRTIVELADDHGIKDLPSRNPDELAEWFHRGADRKKLSLYLEGFALTVSVMQIVVLPLPTTVTVSLRSGRRTAQTV